ncbi:MAG: hypothetical protein H6559_14360 [Lewinellaceae bacterium]|nr:hypothetical protein [Lewinellaceae bacterium]
MNSSASKLSPLQLELLKIYSFDPTEEELYEVKNLLAQFFARRFTDKVAQAAQEKNITDEDLDNWLEEDEQ